MPVPATEAAATPDAARARARGRRLLPGDPVMRFAWSVVVAGLAALGFAAARGDFAPVLHLSLTGLLFVAFTVPGEFVPFRLPRQRNDSRFTSSSLFTFSLLATQGTGPALVAFCGAVLARDVWCRSAPIKTAFNVAQYAVAMLGAGTVLHAVSGLPHPSHPQLLTGADLEGLAAAGLALFALNHLQSGTVSALAIGRPVLAHIREDLSAIAIDGAMLTFAPVVIVVAGAGPALVPLLGLPFAALYSSAREADRRQHDALHDSLTGLANRVLFRRRIGEELERSRHTGAPVAVLMLDLDHFKEVNDALGHGQGDSALQTIAGRLQALVRSEDVVARLGGDEFGALLVGMEDEHEVAAAAERMRDALDEPLVLAGVPVAMAASIGIALSPAHGSDAETLLQRADVALYVAKDERSGARVYDPARDPYGPGRLELTAQLRTAIARGELVVHYQPKLSLHSGRVDGVEALVRWQHPDRGLLAPGAFLELAEQSDLMGPLTVHVLRSALRQAARWRAQGLDLTVAVNLPAQTLLDQSLPQTIDRSLDDCGLPHEALVLELTEGSLMRDPGRSAAILERLSATGVRISMDDFGTGYSSLAWLKRLPVHEVKIDRSFVADMVDDASDAAIVHSTIQLGQTLGLCVVAEGVETEAALHRLAAFGCDSVQGYLLSRPLPAEELTAWLLDREAAPVDVAA